LKLRIVLADDHPFVLLGIRATFSMDENLEVVGEAASAAELLRLLVSTPCDVLVTDFAMPEQGLRAEDGLRLIKRLRRDWPAISIVVLTSMSNVAILRSILAAGAMSLLNKVESMDELATAVKFAGVGRRYLSSSIRRSLPRWRWPAPKPMRSEKARAFRRARLKSCGCSRAACRSPRLRVS
jgi:two-component system capsular synthesis response regulator RcsB